MKIINYFLLTLFLSFQYATAAYLDSYCVLSVNDGQIKGQDLDQRLALASVSKVFVTQWALSWADKQFGAKGVDFRFETKVFITPTHDKPGFYNIHLKGGGDPYFSKESFHLMISELNKMGIRSIDRFTFDENFNFVWNARADRVAILEYSPVFPTPEDVLQALQKYRPFLVDYSVTAQKLRRMGTQLIANPKFSVNEFAIVNSNSFKPLANTQVHSMKSAPLSEVLKEMNRNSNNLVANMLFTHFGGPAAYKAHIKKEFGFDESDVHLVNGSGAPVVVDGKKHYNQATCRTVIKVLAWLYGYMNDDSINKGLRSILAVSGENNDNTVDISYHNETTDRALIAKTGTTNPAITLGGVASTEKGPVLFYYNMKTGDVNTGGCMGNCRQQWRAARGEIRNRVTNLINREYGGDKKIAIENASLISYDFTFN